MSRKTQHTRFEDKILRKLANEDKPQVVTACPRLKNWSQFLQSFPGTTRQNKLMEIWHLVLGMLKELFYCWECWHMWMFYESTSIVTLAISASNAQQGPRYVTDNKGLPIGVRPFMSVLGNFNLKPKSQVLFRLVSTQPSQTLATGQLSKRRTTSFNTLLCLIMRG